MSVCVARGRAGDSARLACRRLALLTRFPVEPPPSYPGRGPWLPLFDER